MFEVCRKYCADKEEFQTEYGKNWDIAWLRLTVGAAGVVLSASEDASDAVMGAALRRAGVNAGYARLAIGTASAMLAVWGAYDTWSSYYDAKDKIDRLTVIKAYRTLVQDQFEPEKFSSENSAYGNLSFGVMREGFFSVGSLDGSVKSKRLDAMSGIWVHPCGKEGAVFIYTDTGAGWSRVEHTVEGREMCYTMCLFPDEIFRIEMNLALQSKQAQEE